MDYIPQPLAQGDIESLRASIERELQTIADTLGQTGVIRFEVQNAPPAKNLNVNFAYFAAGTVGVDEGFYYFANGSWTLLS